MIAHQIDSYFAVIARLRERIPSEKSSASGGRGITRAKLANIQATREDTNSHLLYNMTTKAVDLLDNSPWKPDTEPLTSACLLSPCRRSAAVPRSVLEAIRMGIWDFEPPEVAYNKFDAANAMPGTREKLCLLAERAQRGLPLWHVNDRNDVEAPPPASLRRRKPR
jgi:hypothetical protein